MQLQLGFLICFYAPLNSLNFNHYFIYLHRQLPALSVKITQTALMNGALQLFLWQFLPTFICDIAFYWMLFLAPYSAWHCFKAQLAEGERDNNPARDFLLWLWRKAKISLQNLRTTRRFWFSLLLHVSFFWFLRLTFIIFLTLSFRLFVLSHLFLFLKKYPGMLFTVQSWNLNKVNVPLGREPEREIKCCKFWFTGNLSYVLQFHITTN